MTQQDLQNAIDSIINMGYATEEYVQNSVQEESNNIHTYIEQIKTDFSNTYVDNLTFVTQIQDIQSQIPSVEGFITEEKIDLKIINAVSSVYRLKGSKDTYDDLPNITESNIGDVWNIIDTGQNYVWTGSEWDALGGVTDLSNFYNKTEIDNKLKNVVVDAYSTAEADALFAKKTEIPNINNLASITFVNETKNEIIKLIPDVSGFITEIPSEYITETELQDKNLATKQFVEDLIKNIPSTDLSGYATEEWVQNQGYLTEHQSLDDYALKTELFSGDYEDLNNKPFENDFTLRDTVSEDTTNVLRELEIAGDKWKIEAGLDKDQILELGFVTTDNLSTILNEYSKTEEIESIIANYLLANYGNGNTEEY